MGTGFGVYRNWIWEFGDLKSDTPILWGRGSIWPNTIISNAIYIYFPLGSIVFGKEGTEDGDIVPALNVLEKSPHGRISPRRHGL